MKSDIDTEYLYSPSEWTKRYSTSDECLIDYVKIIHEKSQIVHATVPCILDVPYGVLEKEKYDIFGTDLPDNVPIIFFIHGGYWQEEIIGRNNSSFVSEVFYKKGIKSFIIGYELCPTVQLDDIIQQTEKALRVCLEYAKNKKSSGIYLMGHSAGAHLVVHFFSRFREIVGDEDVQLFKAAFLIGGVYDLSPLLLTSYNKALKLTTDSAKKFSPMEQVITKSDVEFFVIVGENDSPAFISQSEEFDKKLKLQDVTSKLVILKNIDHFNIVEKLTEEEFPLTELILKIVKKNEL